MGVISTGAIFKTLTFDGRSSSEFNVYITGEGVFNAPERAVEMISIPGRNGAFALDNGRFENIEVTYNCGIAGDSDTDFAEAVSAFRNWLCSRNGYVRLTDDYNAGEYRMAVYKSGLEVTAERLIAGEFPIVFECKPQRFLTSGEDKITVGEWGETTTETGDIVEIENPDGILSVKSLTADINAEQDLNGYANPWPGGGGKNLLDTTPYSGLGYNIAQGTAVNLSTSAVEITKTSNGLSFPIATNWGMVDFKTKPLSAGTYRLYVETSEANSRVSFYVIDIDGNIRDVAYNMTGVGTLSVSKTLNEGEYIILAAGLSVAGTQTLKYPQVESGNSFTGYAPYSNICPITGWTDCEVTQTGTNIWDEEWEAGGISTANGGNTTTAGYYRSKNYIPALSNTNYYWNVPTSMNAFFYDTDKNFINWTVGNNAVVTTPSGTAFIRFRNSTANTWTPYNNDISINYPATDTGYHAYNGTTYSTALGSTVYGGTLDIVSGELTITHISKTYNGTESWLASAQTNAAYFVLWNQDPSKSNTDTTQKANWLIGGGNSYQTFGYYRAQANGGVCVGNRIGTTDYKWADATEFKAYLAENPLQIVYELATPTTTTLTAQQVQLLLGENNIWADTGNVTVEFGQNPNILVNPTLFESRPMLGVTGSGAVNLNDDTIQINNDPIGDVVIYSQNTKNTASAWTIPIETEFANTGDTIYVSRATYEVTWTLGNKYFNDAVVTSVTGPGTAGISVGSNNVFPEIWLQELQFTFGTSASYTVTADYSFDTQDYGTLTGDITLTLSYNGASQLSLSHSATRPTQFGSKNPTKGISDVILSSTKTALGNPLYIDLNIGEAYKIENDVPVSVNNGVVIPAELPTLTPGANTITYDNTITRLDIVPRWWKI